MSSISALNIAIPDTRSQAASQTQAPALASVDTNAANSNDPFGPAVTLDLSAPAQAIVDAQSTAADSTAPASSTDTSSDTTTAAATTTSAASTDTSSTPASNAAPAAAASPDSSSGSGSASGSSSSSSSSSSDSSSSSSSAPPPPAGGGGGGGGAGGGGGVSASAVDDVDVVIEQVALQVGIVAANELVDKNGNIDRVGLAEALAKQQAQADFVSGKAAS